MTVIAVLLAAAAAALLVSGPPRLPAGVGAGRPQPAGWPAPGAPTGLLLAVVGTWLVVSLEGRRLALAGIVLAAAAAVGVLVRRAARARAAERRRALVVDTCEVLVGELRAGQPLLTSLEHCVEVWPEMGPVVVAGRLGADVPAALRLLGALPGAEGLREVASAWHVAQRSGSGLAVALGQVAATARQRQATRHLVAGELASAQATARLVALLPVAALAMAGGIGGRPWGFLLGTPVGLACLAAGLASAFAGLLWIDRIAAAVTSV